jgi:hypothetical protein
MTDYWADRLWPSPSAPVPEPPESLIEAVAVWLIDTDHECYGGSYAFPREIARKILREAVNAG